MQADLVSKLVLKTQIDGTSYTDACDRIQHWTNDQTSCYVVAANVHVVMTAYWDVSYRAVLEGAALVTPDGMPLVWAMRWLGIPQQQRVYGPDLMLAWCQRAAQTQLPIYLYGGTAAMLERVTQALSHRFPDLKIAGSYAPPFRALTVTEENADIERIHQSQAAVVFVALGCPKQEQWMARQQGQLNTVMIGVGAAFSFLSGDVTQAPRWMMRLGLEWAFRFSQEPRRLWQRYLVNNPAFVILLVGQLGWRWLTSVWPIKQQEP